MGARTAHRGLTSGGGVRAGAAHCGLTSQRHGWRIVLKHVFNVVHLKQRNILVVEMHWRIRKDKLQKLKGVIEIEKLTHTCS